MSVRISSKPSDNKVIRIRSELIPEIKLSWKHLLVKLTYSQVNQVNPVSLGQLSSVSSIDTNASPSGHSLTLHVPLSSVAQGCSC